ncbi:hypothetical protein ABTX82_39070 [Streptomyces lavendulae]|uniref:hypothetical protein n=1 Tax=Streptomyces lavendulae TaxID=1914 RepID=UPI00331C5579
MPATGELARPVAPVSVEHAADAARATAVGAIATPVHVSDMAIAPRTNAPAHLSRKPLRSTLISSPLSRPGPYGRRESS